MAKLSEKVKNTLRDKLLQPYNEKISAKGIEIQRCIDEFQLSFFPEDVINIYNQYPKMFTKYSIPISFYGIDDAEWHSIIDGYKKTLDTYYMMSVLVLYTSDYIKESSGDIIKDIINSNKVNSLGVKYRDVLLNITKELIPIKAESKSLNIKLHCVFGSINTISQLKQEFPEAYSIYQKLYTNKNNANNSDSNCDAIEEVRALINNSNKDK